MPRSQRTTGRGGGAAGDGEEGGERVPLFMGNSRDLNPQDLRSWARRTGLHFSAAAAAPQHPPPPERRWEPYPDKEDDLDPSPPLDVELGSSPHVANALLAMASSRSSLHVVAPDSYSLLAPDSMGEELALDSEMATVSMAPKLVVEDSECVEVVPDSLESLASDATAEELAPDSVADGDITPKLCSRCNTIHGINDNEGCRLARRLASRCGRCGLVHKDYDLTTWIIYDMDTFDCKIFIPDLEKLQMKGNTIIVPEHVLKKMDQDA
jgi:hypothetical protein